MMTNKEDSPKLGTPRLEKPAHVPQPHDERVEELRLAIENLENFSHSNSDAVIPHVHCLDVEHGHIISADVSRSERMVDLARCFVTALLSDEVRSQFEQKRKALQGEILKAIDIIKANYLILDKLREGDESDKKLVETAITAINHFNTVMKENPTTDASWKSRLARFIFSKSGLSIDENLQGKTIDIPLPIFSQAHSPHLKVPKFISRKVHKQLKDSSALAAKKKVALVENSLRPGGTSCKPTRREVDAFRVKAITMIRDYGFQSTTINEALTALRQSPIQASMEENANASEEGFVVTFRQELQPFPGELLVLEGGFKRDSKLKIESIPIPESFRLFTKSTQTGFPHPLQHTGWGLSDKMIPPFPHSLEKIPYFQDIYNRKKRYAHKLLPEEDGIFHAKQILSIKKRAFNRHIRSFSAQHKELASALLTSSSSLPMQKKAIQTIDAFFHNLPYQKDAYSYLSNTYQTLINLFLNNPYDALQEAWLTESNPQLFEANLERRYRGAVRIFYRTIRESEDQLNNWLENPESTGLTTEALEYIALMGPCFAKSACVIYLQALSEKMIFSSPILSPFDQIVQELLYRQQIAFLEEDELVIPEDEEEQIAMMTHRLERLLQGDLETVIDPSAKREDIPHKIVGELEAYYVEERQHSY